MQALSFKNVSKSFVHHAGQMLLRDRILDLVRRSKQPRFEALKDISFDLEPGEGLAVVGANGAGKSTLLNLATGLLAPDCGSISVHGRVGSVLELGSGFHPDLTGAENVRVNAALLGLSRRETAVRFEEIVDFSGIREFISEPLRTYSAGMTMRLAFSVAISTDPDILLIDEVIGVGDQAFVAKCLDKIRSFQTAGKSLVLASHSLELLADFCQRAIWLDRGRIAAAGSAREVLDAYRDFEARITSGKDHLVSREYA